MKYLYNKIFVIPNRCPSEHMSFRTLVIPNACHSEYLSFRTLVIPYTVPSINLASASWVKRRSTNHCSFLKYPYVSPVHTTTYLIKKSYHIPLQVEVFEHFVSLFLFLLIQVCVGIQQEPAENQDWMCPRCALPKQKQQNILANPKSLSGQSSSKSSKRGRPSKLN